MIGPSPEAKGGMASVIATYRDAGLFATGHCQFIPTAGDGSKFRKLLIAAVGLLRFVAVAATGRVGALHVHGASYASFWRKQLFMRAAEVFAIPVIFHLHGGEFRKFVEQLGVGERTRMLSTLGKCCLVLALNDEVASWLKSLLPGSRVEVMPNPIELSRYPTSFTGRENTILFLGRLEAEKGIFDLIDAFSIVRSHIPDARLVFGGTGTGLASLQSEVARRDLEGAVFFPGWVSGDAKRKLLLSAGVFVLPSYAEGMPISVLEAMASGLPVVATSVGGSSMLLQDGAGYLVSPGNVGELASALLGALKPDESMPRAEHAYARVLETYAAHEVVTRLLAVYGEVSR